MKNDAGMRLLIFCYCFMQQASNIATPVYTCQQSASTQKMITTFKENITEKLDKNVHVGNKNDAGGAEKKQDLASTLFCGLSHTCINKIYNYC